MKSTSAEYLERLKDAIEARKIAVRILYRRRYFNGAAFVYESTDQILTDKDIEEITPINWKMDAKSQNRILASNVSLRLKNEDWFWVKENINGGAFAPDATAPDGYDDYRIKFTIQHGILKDDGTYEYLSLFTGFSSDIVYTTDKLSAEIRILGRELELAEGNAQNISIAHTNAVTVPAAGDGSNTIFATLKSVWEISAVKVASFLKFQGTQYRLSDMNTPDTEARITFEAGATPGIGEAVTWNGRQWLQNKTVDDLVGRLCDEAGIGPSERVITPPTFPAIDQSHNIDDAPDWSASTRTFIDVASAPGLARLEWFLMSDFQSPGGAFSAASTNPTWIGSYTVLGYRMRINGTTTAYLPSDRAYGTWEWSIDRIGAPADNAEYRFIWDAATNNGYALWWNSASGGFLDLRKYTAGSFVVIGTGILVPGHGLNRRLGVSRATDGTFTVYVGGGGGPSAILYTATDNTHTQSTRWWVVGFGAGINSQSIGNLYYSNTVHTSYFINPNNPAWVNNKGSDFPPPHRWESNEIDLLAAPTAWLPMLITAVTNDGTFVVKTATASVSGGPYDAEVALDGSNIPQSALKQYIKIIFEATHGPIFNTLLGPELDSLILRWQGSELFIGQADFKGRSCLSAIQRLAEIVDCEFGFNGDGTFFFRPKGVSPAPVIDLSQHNFIIRVSSLVRGFDAVSNVVTVSYGQYYNETSADSVGDPAPNSQDRFGDQLLAKVVNDFLFANNADFAGAMAGVLLESRKEPRVRIVADARIIPPLDLGDVVRFGFSDNPVRDANYFGDPQNPDPVFGEDFRMILRPRLFKTLGVTYDIKAGKNMLELIEVL